MLFLIKIILNFVILIYRNVFYLFFKIIDDNIEFKPCEISTVWDSNLGFFSCTYLGKYIMLRAVVLVQVIDQSLPTPEGAKNWAGFWAILEMASNFATWATMT